MDALIETELRKIWTHVGKRSFAKGAADLDALERLVRGRARSRRALHLARIAAARVTFLVFHDRPVEELLPLAEFLVDAELPSDEILGRIGTLALHCETKNERAAGARYLARALDRARRDGVGSEQLIMYQSILERLTSGMNGE